MNAVVFEAQVRDNVIRIPEQYQDQIPSSVLVTVIDQQSFSAVSRGPTIIPRTGTGPKTFLPPHIDTTGWKFNREEANER